MKEIAPRDSGMEINSIGKVVELLKRDYPSISASSIRFLERIGLVTPARTPGGHRLFRPVDIARIRTIKRLQDERYTLEEIADRLKTDDDDRVIDLPRLLDRALAGDAPGATHLVAAALDRGLTPQEVFDEALSPTLVEVGDRWAAGTITVAQEHAASEVIRDLVAIIGAPRVDLQGDAPVVVAAAVAGERHVIGLQMLSTLLRLRGYRIHYLGADVDADFLADAVLRNNPGVVFLSATLDDRLPAAESAIAAVKLAGRSRMPAIVIGGQMAGRHADRLASHGVTVVSDQEPGAAAERVHRLLTASEA